MTEHSPAIQIQGYRAQCSCGWQSGILYEDRQLAWESAEDHVIDHDPSYERVPLSGQMTLSETVDRATALSPGLTWTNPKITTWGAALAKWRKRA